MRFGITVFVCGCAMVATSPGEARSLHRWDQASSVAAGTIAALALGVHLIKSDDAGLAQAGLSMVAGTGTAFALKSLVHERRPDGASTLGARTGLKGARRNVGRSGPFG